eukprot:CAMPEP_0172769772 /NCGR_PEP_ID=MMETSP1074-20121228/187264_1 /TAXON_ID=2916 /ORGANISM="Ceratium fusus, Strain PA161109" /LENGTH=88 /DNA_ID=CAMNT_0013605403 /DNA_START=44 /DNA_END=306 /DNA_ORIENTATION=-
MHEAPRAAHCGAPASCAISELAAPAILTAEGHVVRRTITKQDTMTTAMHLLPSVWQQTNLERVSPFVGSFTVRGAGLSDSPKWFTSHG